MAVEQSKISQLSQLGMEAVQGTAVAATKRVLALSFEPKPEGQISMFRPMGYKFATTASPEKEWATAKVTGAACYNALTYVLCGIIHKSVPTLVGGAYTWAFTMNDSSVDTIQTYTLEHGSDVRSIQLGFGLFTEMSLDFSRGGIKFDGTLLTQAVVDGANLAGNERQRVTITGGPTGGTFTLTFSGQTTAAIAYNATPAQVQTALANLTNIGSGNVLCLNGSLPTTPVDVVFTGTLGLGAQTLMTATGAGLTGGSTPAVAVTEIVLGGTVSEVAPVPIIAKTVDLYMTTDYTVLGTSPNQMLRGFQAAFKMSNRFSPIWPLNSSKPSWDGFVEDAPPTELTVTVAADSAGMAFLSQQRLGTTIYVRVKATGSLIDGTHPYSLTMDMACKINKPFQYKDADNVIYAAEYPLEIVHDIPWGSKALVITLVNGLATL